VLIRSHTPPAAPPDPSAGRRLTGRRPSTLVALTAVGALVAGLTAITAVTAASALAAGTELVVQAEAFTGQSGAKTEHTADTGGGLNVGWLASGDWMSYAGVDLGTPGQLTATVRVSSNNTAGGTVELRADSQTGALLGSYPIKSTGGWQKWVTQSAVTSSALTGKHTVFITLHSTQPSDFVNVNWFSIKSTGTGATPVTTTTAAPAPTTTTPMPSMSMPSSTPTTMAPAPATGWVSVDPAKQAADTAAFFALTPKPITNNPVRVPEFNASCKTSHHAADDPIVYPGVFGASHNHTFIGNVTTDANSTLASLKAGGTTCAPLEDHSAYWIPTLYQNGKVVDPEGITVYYGSRLKDPSKTQPFPAGFRMITGDAKNQVDTPDHQGNHFWCAGIGGEVGRTADGVMPICAPTAQIVRQVTFADCWDGVHLDSPDHKAHVSNGANGGCPAAFPVPIPNVSFVIAYPLSTNTAGITLSSGTTFSMHADFFNAWDDAAQAARVRNCLDQDAKCNSAGNF
jgi:hypothetical protein